MVFVCSDDPNQVIVKINIMLTQFKNFAVTLKGRDASSNPAVSSFIFPFQSSVISGKVVYFAPIAVSAGFNIFSESVLILTPA